MRWLKERSTRETTDCNMSKSIGLHHFNATCLPKHACLHIFVEDIIPLQEMTFMRAVKLVRTEGRSSCLTADEAEKLCF